MSFFVTRPETPVPSSWVVSTLFSLAILRTSGDDFVRRRSSNEAMVSSSLVDGASGEAASGGAGWGAGGCWVAARGGVAGACGAAAGCGATGGCGVAEACDAAAGCGAGAG